MREVRTLALLELRALYGINRFLHTKDGREKRRLALLGTAWALILLMVFSYVGALVYSLWALGLSEIAPAYLVMAASLLVFAFGLFKAGYALFERRGYDMLCAMPVRPSSVVISRFAALYAQALLWALAVMLPGLAVYGTLVRPGAGIYMTALIGTLCVPAIPLVASALVGMLVMAVSARTKHKSLIQSVLMVALVVGVLLLSFGMTEFEAEMTAERLASLAGSVGSVIERLYPPAMWLGRAMVHADGLSLLAFACVSAAVLGLAVWVVSRSFEGIMRRLASVHAGHDYKPGAMESRGMLKALYIREAKRYFSSSVYVTNTIIGPIMGCVMCAALLVSGVDTLRSAMPFEVDIVGLLPFAVAAVFTMMTTTSIAISMEGKQIWAIKSLPVSAKAWLDSKILLNLSLMLPFYLLSEAFLALAVRPGLVEMFWMAVIPAALMLFAVVAGIAVNLKFHSFDWEKEEAVVKQSLSALLGGFAGMLVSVFAGGIAFLVPAVYEGAVKAAMCAGILAGTAWLYRKNNRVDMRAL